MELSDIIFTYLFKKGVMFIFIFWPDPQLHCIRDKILLYFNLNICYKLFINGKKIHSM